MTTLVLSITSLFAQSNGMGVGLSTDGLNGKYWLNGTNAVSVNWNLGTALSADYLFDKPDMLDITSAATPVYYGAGVGISLQDGLNSDLEETTELHLSVRGVAGVSYYLSSMPMDIYLELTPAIGLLGGSGFGIGSALGVRYFF